MKLIEFHILQSFPVSCLNRDDVNSPKTALFGGKQRARISSQCYKRAIRLQAKDLQPSYFMGIRTKKELEQLFIKEFIELGIEKDEAQKKAKEFIGKGDLGKDTCIFLSPTEFKVIAKNHLEGEGSKFDWSTSLVNAADIALFGRMLANTPKANIEAASMFAHAISTHHVNNEIDFFTAIDDLSKDQGSAHMGMLEFNSALYYRYMGLNLDLLKDNLTNASKEDISLILKAFYEAVITAVPHARKATMNAATLPSYIKIICRSKGSPLQLINAFEEPIKSNDGYVTPSKGALENHWNEVKQFFGIEPDLEINIPAEKKTLEKILNEVSEWSVQS